MWNPTEGEVLPVLSSSKLSSVGGLGRSQKTTLETKTCFNRTMDTGQKDCPVTLRNKVKELSNPVKGAPEGTFMY